MSDSATFTFPKSEKLCSKKRIDKLFLDRSRKKKTDWPIKVVYQLDKREDGKASPVEVLVSVSKRSFKRAVKRNYVKRQLREAYRLNKQVLHQAMASCKEQCLLVAFIWLDDKLHESQEVEKVMVKLLHHVAQNVATMLEESNS